MMDRRKQLARTLASGKDRTLAFFSGLDQSQLETRVYEDGAQWSTKAVLAHLVTIERSMHHLFRNILAGGPGSPEDFDIDRFNRKQPQRYAQHSLVDLLEEFTSVRNETIAIVEGITEADLDRVARHAYHGRGTLERFIRWADEHALEHEDHIRNVLA